MRGDCSDIQGCLASRKHSGRFDEGQHEHPVLAQVALTPEGLHKQALAHVSNTPYGA
jgi:hypothetical protein